LEGGRYHEGITDDQLPGDSIHHLFIHFNIGVPYDHISPGIFEFDLDDHLSQKLEQIKAYVYVDFGRFDFYTVLTIQSLITDLLSLVPESNWKIISTDKRILEVLRYIESNLAEPLPNQLLAAQAKLATIVFNRRFKEETGSSPQQYVKEKRIYTGCSLLHHSDFSIEQIAADTGFADRYHFSKVFKNQIGLSPARYRKEFGVK
jgi:AraC-like DNA-binding protein